MSFTVRTDVGVVSAHVPAGAYMDAALSPDVTMAGLELAVDTVVAHDSPRDERHAACVVSLSMDPNTMKALVLLLAQQVKMPLFTDREWTKIADALYARGILTGERQLEDYAERIRTAPQC